MNTLQQEIIYERLPKILNFKLVVFRFEGKELRLSEKVVQPLRNAGLTTLQATVYLFLVQTGKQTGSFIANKLNTDRSNVYQAISQLHKIGLVEQILGTPIIWEAVPLQEALSILLECKKEEYNKIQSDLNGLLQMARVKNATTEKDNYSFKILNSPSKEKTFREISRFCANLKESCDILINNKTFFTTTLGNADDHIAAMKRGVTYRVIVSELNMEWKQENLKRLITEPNFNMKYISFVPEVQLAMHDEKEVWVNLSKISGPEKDSFLYVNHPGCVEIFQSFFEGLWNKAAENVTSVRA